MRCSTKVFDLVDEINAKQILKCSVLTFELQTIIRLEKTQFQYFRSLSTTLWINITRNLKDNLAKKQTNKAIMNV